MADVSEFVRKQVSRCFSVLCILANFQQTVSAVSNAAQTNYFSSLRSASAPCVLNSVRQVDFIRGDVRRCARGFELLLFIRA